LRWNMKVSIDLHDEVSLSKRTENQTQQTQAERRNKAEQVLLHYMQSRMRQMYARAAC